MSGLALDGESNTVGGLGLDLKVRLKLVSINVVCAEESRRRTRVGVVEVLVQEL